MEQEKIIEKLKEIGFETVALLDVNTLEALQEVRDMCAVNTCGMYEKRWSCPPGCGTIEECAARMKKYSNGLILQTVGDIEDSFDFEGIMEVSKLHGDRFLNVMGEVKNWLSDYMILGACACRKCKECTYPDAPCRFPEEAMSSMEANGLFVSDVCKKNNVAYNYGEGKMCYTGCLLFND